MKCVYAISLLTKNPIVKPGESFEIECYLTGYGEPTSNKLQVYVSKEGFLNDKAPGYIEVSGKTEGKSFKFGDEYKQRHEFKGVGVQIGLATVCFKSRDEFEGKLGQTPKWIIPMILSEARVKLTPLILLHLNTNEKARSGDYLVHVIFTYSQGENDFFITEKEARIHITSLIERHACMHPV
jgi:hypothetical protein